MQTENLTTFFSAFTSAPRLAVIKALLDGPLNVTRIQERTGLKQSTVSGELYKLGVNGLVTFKRKVTQHIYELRQPEIVRDLIILAESFSTGPLYQHAVGVITQQFPSKSNKVMNLHPNEPVFILRGQDVFAPKVITAWADLVIHDPNATQENFDQAASAWVVANEMNEWQTANPHLVKIPDLKNQVSKAA